MRTRLATCLFALTATLFIALVMPGRAVASDSALRITPGPLPSGTVGVFYDVQLQVVDETGGVVPGFGFSYIAGVDPDPAYTGYDGNLPQGITLTPAGHLNGVPVLPQHTYVDIVASNSDGDVVHLVTPLDTLTNTPLDPALVPAGSHLADGPNDPQNPSRLVLDPALPTITEALYVATCTYSHLVHLYQGLATPSPTQQDCDPTQPSP